MTATKTTTKPVSKTSTKGANKAVNKTPAKTAQKVTLLYAALLGEALGGKYGSVIQRFYVSAVAYHVKALTAFPRARNAGEPLIPAKDVPALLEKHAQCSIPAGLRMGQRLFDEMMVEAAKVPKGTGVAKSA